MRDDGWSRTARWAAGVHALALVAGVALVAALNAGAFGTAPDVEWPCLCRQGDALDDVAALRAFDLSIRTPRTVASAALGVAFAALVPLGSAIGGVLGRRRAGDRTVALAFGVAGLLGLTGQLVTLGAIEAAASPFPPGEAVQAARVGTILLGGVASWLGYAALLAAAGGAGLAAGLAAAAGWRGWARCSVALAVVYVLAVVVQVAPVPSVLSDAVLALSAVVPAVSALWLVARLREPVAAPEPQAASPSPGQFASS